MKKALDNSKKIKTPLEELDVLSKLKDSVEWDIFKRLCKRYIEGLKNSSFDLIQSDPKFVLKHTDLRGQAFGIRMIVKIVEESSRERDKLEKK
jgi:hypothetical protein